MKQKNKHLIRISLGIILIIIGIIGLFLPILQGILFIGAGILLLQNKSWKEVKEFIQDSKEKIKKRLRKKRN
jgi:uncharacterized membrane protein YbaN (DUF454 family)